MTPLPNETNSDGPPALSNPHRETQRRQSSERGGNGEYILEVGIQVGFWPQIISIESWCGAYR